ncbi:DUF420 domain-containing protein [Acanthopleuribacter pedis]|uniref:DUF420 domain-containing protein n=1 Tax=Acanthopleuribacter pedis TaxID=442870 RepID=A0A8J7Q574_9BACT|nr:DUF420 domain-containing protein [Acanthopleuribacter pedis]MBO1318342.1 DUF420 domain-containing protein [Acanthopleuribacter pedis]
MMNLMFWGYAYLLTTTAVFFAILGWRNIIAGDIQAHKQKMGAAINLILFFVVSYVVKVIVLGREDKTNWTPFYLYTLYIHETFIALMLLTGGWARWLAHTFRTSLTGDSVSDVHQKQRRLHGKLGRACIASALCGLFTATIILWGMANRL